MKTQRYIVVDDDLTNNMICEFSIKRFDREADIKMFMVPEDAIAWIQEEYITANAMPTVLFLDVNMPSMTGWEFLDVFLQFNETVRDQFTVYILSSSIEDFTEKSNIYSCIQGFLSKPLKISNLEKIKELQELYMD